MNLNGLSVYKPLFLLDLMIIFTMNENISKTPDFDILSLLDIKKDVRNDPMVSIKVGILNENITLS